MLPISRIAFIVLIYYLFYITCLWYLPLKWVVKSHNSKYYLGLFLKGINYLYWKGLVFL